MPSFEINSNPSVSSGKISGRVSFPGISLNNRLYLPEELAKGDGITVPILLNHGDLEGAEDIGPELLPVEYRNRLAKSEEIILGSITYHFNFQTRELLYDGQVTDPFFSQKHVLEQMSVSQGVSFDPNLSREQVCGTVQCYQVVRGIRFVEMSLVYHPGFGPIATLAAESHNGSLSGKITHTNLMSNKDEIANENCDKDPDKVNEDLQSSEPITSAGKEQCPEGMVFDNDAQNCVPMPSSTGSNDPAPSPPVADAAETLKQFDDDPTNDDDKAKEYQRLLEKSFPGLAVKATGSANADIASEKRRLVSELKALERKDLASQLDGADLEIKAMEKVVAKARLDAEYRKIKEMAKPVARTGTTNTSAKEMINGSVRTGSNGMAMADEVNSGVLSWTKAVIAKENVSSTFLWNVPKQEIYEKYLYHDKKDSRGNVLAREKVCPEGSFKAGEAVTHAPDLGRSVDNQVFILPEGKIVTPVRQFCQTKVLEPGQAEGFFHDFGKIDFADVTEGTDLAEQAISVRSSGGEGSARGKLVTVKYRDLHKANYDLMSALQRQFAFESVNDESVEVVKRAYNDDTANVTDERKQKGGGVKENWINGNTGAAITADNTITSATKLTFKALLRGKRLIEDQGVDVSDLTLYTSTKGVEDLIQDPAIDSYIQFSRPEIITEADVARIAGVNIVKSTAIADGAGTTVNAGKRSVLFKPFAAFGIVSERDFTLEAQRWNKQQVINVTGTQVVGGFVKNQEYTCRISHTSVDA